MIVIIAEVVFLIER
jgi:hypothetical protein